MAKLKRPVHPVTNLRLVKEHNSRLNGDGYQKPVYALLFERNGINCRVRVINNGELRPLGQDLIDAMADYLRRKEVTEAALLDCKIID